MKRLLVPTPEPPRPATVMWAGSQIAAPGPGCLVRHPFGDASYYSLWGHVLAHGGPDGLSRKVAWCNGRVTWERLANLAAPPAIAGVLVEQENQQP